MCLIYGEGQSQLKIKNKVLKFYSTLECVHGTYKDIIGFFFKGRVEVWGG